MKTGLERRFWATATVAATLLFGLSSLRAVLPQMSFLLRDRLGWDALEIARAGLGLFCLGFTVALIARLLGVEGKLLLCTLLPPLARLAAQLWRGDPIGDLVLQALGTAGFFLALAALATTLRGLEDGGGCFAVGWIVGVLADSALHGVYGTWDLVWRQGLLATLLQTVLVIAACAASVRFWILWRRDGGAHGDLSRFAAWGWLGIGPMLFLLTALFSNPGRYATLLADSTDLAWLLIAASQLTALVIVTAWLRRGGSPGALLLLPSAVALVALCWRAWPGGTWAALQLYSGGLLSTLMLSVVLISVEAGPRQAGLRRLTWAHGGTLLCFGVFLFVHGAALDVRMPFSGDRLLSLSALLLSLAAFGAGGVLNEYTPAERRGWRLWQAVGLALALPALISAWTDQGVAEAGVEVQVAGQMAEQDPWPLRVMTYNLHCGVDPRGDLGLEAMARAIEEESPDIVALQEVSRGWTVNGSVDMVEWLARRLNMHYVFAGTADPLWGNAVLSRLPILGQQSLPLPSEGLKLNRGSLDVMIGLGNGESLRVLATHLHHKKADSNVRQNQIAALLPQWHGSSRTVILGDFNALPEWPEIAALGEAGLVDAFATAGSGDGFTFHSGAPQRRIDYIWLSPDLVARKSWVPATEASDHLPVMALIQPAARFQPAARIQPAAGTGGERLETEPEQTDGEPSRGE